MKQEVIGRGAEAILIKKGDKIVKDRVKKSYRLPYLDLKLRKTRTKKEATLLKKASNLIPVPILIETDEKEKIEMQFLQGLKLSENLDSLTNSLEICKQIGENIAKLHDADIIHGDLTTSNMIYSKEENKLYFIDFGLGFHSAKIEDKAVDLHLIKEALEAKHFKKYKELFNSILKGYNSSKNSSVVIKRLEAVESRGRYKAQY